jgi:L-histidine N-alpha-methyltransferase
MSKSIRKVSIGAAAGNGQQSGGVYSSVVSIAPPTGERTGRAVLVDQIPGVLTLIDVPGHAEELSQVVAEGLSAAPKRLPCRYFYDTAGSHLFERICQLPEYYLTRTEQSILECGAEEIAEAAGRDVMLVEFGSGSSCKTRILMEAFLARQRRLHYVPIDISREFLRASALALLSDYDRLTITAVAAEYNDGIEHLPTHNGPRLILFLGSNIGNFAPDEAAAFLERVRSNTTGDDRMLVGVDLLKSPSIIEPAYNDSAGVTEAFNKNLLLRVSRELGADFNPDCFEHSAPLVDGPPRIEMRLVSRRNQTVTIRAIGRAFDFRQGEYIHTENSHKYSPAAFEAICRDAGWRVQERWTDDQEWFAVALLRPEGT